MSLGEKIRKSRRELDLTQEEFSEKIGVTSRTIIRFEKDEIVPKVDDLMKIASLIGKDVQYFLSDPELEIKNYTAEKLPVQKIPLISWVSANRFGEASDPFPPGDAYEWLYTTAKGGRMFALNVKGDCMHPEFMEGERIIVNPDAQTNNGDFVIVRDNHKDEATFKQLKIYGKKVILHPLNPKYQDIELDHDKRYVIVGKVVGKDKKY